jgi:hypothetical protein
LGRRVARGKLLQVKARARRLRGNGDDGDDRVGCAGDELRDALAYLSVGLGAGGDRGAVIGDDRDVTAKVGLGVAGDAARRQLVGFERTRALLGSGERTLAHLSVRLA